MKSSFLLGLVTAIGSTAFAAELPTTLPPHPRLLLNRTDIPGIKQRMATQPWAKAHYEALTQQADGWLKQTVKLPDRGGQWYHWYSCPKHGARLRNEGPTRHVCPVDKEVFTGYPYDDVALSSEHGKLAGAVRALGLVHQLTGDARYAVKAKEILLAYAAKYQSYPLHNTRGEAKVGGGKVGPQTLDESTWLITMVEGADCIWDTLSADEQQRVKDGLLLPATDVIRQHKMSIHNIQCWKNSAVGLTGLLLGDMKLVDEAPHSPSGYFNQMAKGVLPDGPWYEGAWGYHFYTMSAVWHLTEGAFHCGIDLYGPEFKRMFDAPIAMAMPDLVLPAFNDSHTVNVAGSAALYETALARYHDDRYRIVLARSGRNSDAALLHGVPATGQVPDFKPASHNYTASGNAVLTAGAGAKATWLCLDYGPHGGGHGHPDKLGFVLYGQGQVLAPDPGTANYGVPIQAGWFRTTLAHNTLIVDEQSQKPAEGKCEAFLATNGFSAVMASAGKIYAGVNFTRTVALIGEKLLVFIDQIQADQPHTFDLAYHNVGQFTAPVGATPFQAPDKPGYSYLRDAKTLPSSTGLKLTFDSDGQQVLWTMAPGEATTFITGTGVGRHTEDRVPLVIARRQARTTAYLWCVALDGKAAPVEVTSEPVKLPDGSSPLASQIAAVRVKSDGESRLLLANPGGARVIIAGQSVSAKIALLEVRGDNALLKNKAE
ncbi:MAG: heparinase II/III family protein [Verrucomicrobia bacterium]|nr:heparinase II/III family protein [Verrucomicrobiota bacterium]